MIATIIGTTGLIGRELVKLLVDDNRFRQIEVFGRRSLDLNHAKLHEHLINFDSPGAWQHLVTGDVFFSTLGTTISQAGSKDAQYKVDYSYQVEFAKAASENGVPVYVLVSAAGASPDSKIFYSRMKGELERDVKGLNFSAIHIIQPGLLHGDRQEIRTGEKIALHALNAINAIGLLRAYRPIHGKTVAQAMINAALSNKTGVHQYTLEDLFELAI